MARGGSGGRRGGGRGRGNGSTAAGGAAGFPAGAQGTRTSFAQSGGKANSFQGGKGGGAWQSPGGGAKGTKTKGKSQFGNSTPFNIRNAGGDGTLIPGAHGGAGRLNLPGSNAKGNKGRTNTSIVKPHQLAPKGFGGGY
jgi:hypothetical protein